MKLALQQVLLATALAASLVDANAKDYQLRHQSLAALDALSEVKATKKKIDPMPTIAHKKEAGNGYKKDSPLYDRQQKYLTSSPPPTTAAPVEGPFGASMSQEAASNLWWKSLTDPYTFFSFLVYYLFHALFFFACGWFYHTKQHE